MTTAEVNAHVAAVTSRIPAELAEAAEAASWRIADGIATRKDQRIMRKYGKAYDRAARKVRQEAAPCR